MVPIDNKVTIAIKKEMFARNISNEELGKILGISRYSVSNRLKVPALWKQLERDKLTQIWNLPNNFFEF